MTERLDELSEDRADRATWPRVKLIDGLAR